MSDSVWPYRQQPTRLPRPWDSPGKNTGVGCHFLLQCINVKVKLLSRVWLLATPWTAAYQAPPSMGFSRQEYWSGLSFPSPGDLPNPGIEPRSPSLQADALTSEPPGKPSQSSNASLPAGIFFVLRLWKLATNPQKLSTLPGLSGVVGPLSSKHPCYLCSLLLINSLLSTILHV